MSATRRTSLALLGATLLTGGVRAQERTRVSLGTATPGGGFPVYGEAFAAAINSADPTLEIVPRNTRGSAENLPMLERGELDLGLVQGEAAHEALAGIGRAPADLRIVSAMYSSAGFFGVRADSPARLIQDLVGKPIAFGAAGSGLVILARYVLDGLGLDMNRDFQAILLERAGDGPAMVADGRAAALWGGGLGWPGFVAVGRLPGRFIAPATAEVAQIRAKHAFLRELTIPQGAYPGLDQPLRSVGSWSFVLCRRDLPDDIGYRVAKALRSAETDLARRLPQAAETTLGNTVAAAPRPELLQAGVARLAREAGIVR